jgi:serine/threonine protein kinase
MDKLVNQDLKCVYYFFNEHKQKSNKKCKIYKVVPNNFYVINELTNIQNIIQYKTYFYVCNNNSKLKLTELDTQNNIIKPQKSHTSKDNNILLEFNNIELTNLKDYILSLECSKRYIYDIIHIYKQLLNSIDLLITNNIIHNSINFECVLVDVNNNNTLLTNFLMSINLSNKNMHEYIKHFILDYEPSYVEWPLELHILAYLITNKQTSLSQYNIEYVINDVISKNTILLTFGDNVVSLYTKEAIKYFKKYVNASYETIVTNMLNYSYTWDNYGLSILFLRILIGLHRTIKIKNKFIIFFMKLLVGNIHSNPEKRLNIVNTLNEFNCILDNMQLQDYKELCKSF